MDLKFYDRINGSIDILPNKICLLGQWQYLGEKESTYINTIPANPGDCIVPDSDLNIVVIMGERSEAFEQIYDSRLLLSKTEASFLNGFQSVLPGESNQAITWDQWDDLSIIDPRIGENILIQPLDHKIAEWLKHLQIICKQPQTYLTMNLEKIPAGYARRFKSKTYTHLASHTEDWEHRTLVTVHPKKVLSLRIEELLTIYENIVTVRLVDRLLKYIINRIVSVEDAQKTIQDVYDYSTELAHNHYLLRKRLSKIWGDIVDPQIAIKQADETINQLKDIKHKIAILTDSALYKQIPRKANIPKDLKITNLFAYDQHYRYVAQLWNELKNNQTIPRQTPLQMYVYYQDICKTYTAYSASLIYKALIQLNFTVKSPKVLEPDGIPIEFSNGVYELEVIWDQADILTVRYGGSELISFVPLPVHLSNSSSQEKIQDIIGYLIGDYPVDDHSGKKYSPYRVLLYYGKGDELAGFPKIIREKLYSFGGSSTYGEKIKRGLLPISPLDLFSVERIGRVIRWAVLEYIYLTYPIKIEMPVQFITQINEHASRWLRGNKEIYEISELPSSKEKNKLNNCLELIRRTEESKPKHLRKNLKPLEVFINKLDLQYKATKLLYFCPLCGKEAPLQNFTPIDQDTFMCHCADSSCDGSWKVWRCNKCKERYPILLPGSLEGLSCTENHGWVDKLFGEDVLALPDPGSFPNYNSFICPRCGYRQGSGETHY